MKEGQRKRRGFEIVMDILSKYKNRLTKSERKQLISALERKLIIQKKGIIFLIDSGKASMTSLADIGSYELGWDRLEESKGQRRKPIEIISDVNKT